jgi:hypothetical protein
MNFNKEIKQTHDEIQKLHDQYQTLNDSLVEKFSDLAQTVKSNVLQKIPAEQPAKQTSYPSRVDVYIHSTTTTTPTTYTTSLIVSSVLIIQMGLIGWILTKKS